VIETRRSPEEAPKNQSYLEFSEEAVVSRVLARDPANSSTKYPVLNTQYTACYYAPTEGGGQVGRLWGRGGGVSHDLGAISEVTFFHRATCKEPYVSIRQHTSAYVSIRQNTSAYVRIRQHTSAYVSIPQHSSAYVCIRQHTSAYVRISEATFLSSIESVTCEDPYVSIRQHTSAYLRS
jgi:hypothetical protein